MKTVSISSSLSDLEIKAVYKAIIAKIFSHDACRISSYTRLRRPKSDRLLGSVYLPTRKPPCRFVNNSPN